MILQILSAQIQSNVKIIRNKKPVVNLTQEIESLDGSKIKIIAIRGSKTKGEVNKPIVTLNEYITIFDTSVLEISSIECAVDCDADNSVKFILNDTSFTIQYRNHGTLIVSKNIDLLLYIKLKLNLRFKSEPFENILINKDNVIRSDSAQIEQLKFLTIFVPFLVQQFESQKKIKQQSNIKKNSISLNIGSAKSLDNLSISLKNLIDFKINFATVYKERFQHSLGLNIGYINANNSIQLDQLFVNSNQIDKNGDIFNGNYQLTNYLENTQFKILKLGITNTFSFKLSNTFDLSCMLNTGTLNLLNLNTHVVSGIVEYTGDYPQYKLSNFNEPTLGFGNFDLSGSRNNYLNTKAAIFFFEPELQINLKLSEIFNSEALSALNFISNCSWLITEDFISNKKTMFSVSPANGFKSANNTLKKLYISNFTYSAGLSWKF